VHKYLDGSVNIFYQRRKLKHKPIPEEKTKQKLNELITINYLKTQIRADILNLH